MTTAKRPGGFVLPGDTEEYVDLDGGGIDLTTEFGVAWHLPEMVGSKGTSVDMDGWNEESMQGRMRRWPGQRRDG